MKIRLAISLVASLGLFHPTMALAQWQSNGNPLSTAAYAQYSPKIASDGAGGAIVTWEDWQTGVYPDIYAQRIDAAGIVQWTLDGVGLCTAALEQLAPKIISDGAGGAIVTWHDNRGGEHYDVYAQRVDAAGVVKWTTDGVVLCATTQDALDPVIIADGAGGAIVAWADYRTGTNFNIYAQRINAAGTVQWTDNGVALCTAMLDQQFLAIAADGAAGAIVTWVDYRTGGADIYARRINAAGAAQWTGNGVAICGDGSDQEAAAITADGAGGAIVTWVDYRAATNSDLYAQRIDAAGTVQWTPNGVGVCTDGSDQANAATASDGAGGAIVSWSDFRSGTSWDIYAQRINAAGTAQWTANGVALCIHAGDQYLTALIGDGIGGAIAAWDHVAVNGEFDVYAQRVNAMGTAQWTTNGVPICTKVNDQFDSRIVSDGSEGAIVTWYDYRSGEADVYALRVDGNGSVPTAVSRRTPPAAFTLRDPYPNPFSVATTVEFELPARASVTIEVFDAAGRRVAYRFYGEMDEGWQSVRLAATDNAGHALPGGVYFVGVHADGNRVTRKMVIMR